MHADGAGSVRIAAIKCRPRWCGAIRNSTKLHGFNDSVFERRRPTDRLLCVSLAGATHVHSRLYRMRVQRGVLSRPVKADVAKCS